ncbi:MAG: DUF4874 domain-containing protein [Firmicutes bacterium]|uniref:DUF4874 domain-containing protein n=1 Tax=Candidatus Stercoripulliclostridium pullicola TaxID=2840953 RepID=A0A940DG51_9FIRM|nr:DUF4874 domain-containing protein [Candidatus Stercoripulliclostridium pullicola]
MRKLAYKTITSILLAAMCLAAVFLTSCNKIKISDYPATGTSYIYPVDGSVAPYDPNSGYVINPSRGMRGETYITLGRNEAYPDSGEDPYERLDDQLTKYAPDGIALMQVYVYLTEYSNTDLPASALSELKAYFEEISRRGVKMLLRFAYEYTSEQKTGPRTRDIVRHCKQLKTFFEENAELIDNTVYAMQLGMIGLWGEGHGNVHYLNKRKVIAAVADMVPDDIFIMVRTPELLSLVPEDEECRFGIHDDFLVGYDHEWGMISFDDPAYPKLLNKSKHALTDGEMPWGDAGIEGIDMLGVLKQCAGYGLTSLSIEHNYIEEGNAYYLKKWQSVYLTGTELEANSLPYNPALLTENGITVFDYLKHHLGYQLVASNLEISDGTVTFMITNYGMAAAHGFRIELICDGKVTQFNGDGDLSSLNQFGQRIFSAPYSGGDIGIRIYSVRDDTAEVKLYNSVPFVNGVNVIYEG